MIREATKPKRFKFGWYGDGGLGDRVIQEIVARRKTATTCLAYEAEDADVQAGDLLDLVDKRERAFGKVLILSVDIRLFNTFDMPLARACGHETMEQFFEIIRFANGRQPFPDEEMRVTHFRFTPSDKAK